MRFGINGYLFTQKSTGVMRLAREILIRLDRMEIAKDMCLVMPEGSEGGPKLERIKTVYYGRQKGNLWEQTSFCAYIRKNDLISVNFNNTKPIFAKGLMFIHDLAYVSRPQDFTSLHGKISCLYHRIIFHVVSRSKSEICTISHFSKQQIIERYHVDPGRIQMIECGWEHMESIADDPTVFSRLALDKGEYYLTIGNLSKMKNTDWIIRCAEHNRDKQFVIVGNKAKVIKEGYECSENVTVTGYLSDGEMKSLIRGCKAFIYPSLYDGFGIPPLEALSMGTHVICSYSSPLTEIYGDTVDYIDPYEYDADLDALSANHHDPELIDRLLKRHSWDRAAYQFAGVLEKQ